MMIRFTPPASSTPYKTRQIPILPEKLYVPSQIQIQDDFLNIITVSIIIAIRIISVKYNLSLPKYK